MNLTVVEVRDDPGGEAYRIVQAEQVVCTARSLAHVEAYLSGWQSSMEAVRPFLEGQRRRPSPQFGRSLLEIFVAILGRAVKK